MPKVRRPRVVSRPARWWRDPIPFAKLVGLSDGEAELLIAQERALRVARIQEQIRSLRNFSNAFNARDGYSLRSRDIVRLHPSKLKKLRDAELRLRQAQSRPHIFFVPKSKPQHAAAQRLAGSILPKQKVYVLHPSMPERAKATYDKKAREIVITTQVKGGELYDILYKMPRKPKSWDQVRRFTTELKRRGMRHGHYRLFTDLYGPIGTTYSLDVLEDGLDEFFSTYTKYMATTVLGWLWLSSSLQKSRKIIRRQRTQAERFQDARMRVRQRQEDLIKRRIGIRTPKRKPVEEYIRKQVLKTKRALVPKKKRKRKATTKKRKRVARKK